MHFRLVSRATPFKHGWPFLAIPKACAKLIEAIGAFSWDDGYSDDIILDRICIGIWITFRRRVKCICYKAVPPNFQLFLDLLNALTKANPSDEDLISGLL